MAGNRIVRWLLPIGFGLLPLTAGGAFAQGSQAEPQNQDQSQTQEQKPSQAEPQSARPSERQLSEKTQEAMIRLHALNQNRAQYANAAAQYVTNPKVAQFLQQRAADYQQSDQRLMALAQSYGVNLESPDSQRKAGDIQEQWNDDLQKLQQADRAEAANDAVDTFIKRNEGAIEDLRTLRGDVQEEQVRQLINQRISALEQESTQAQALKQQLEQAQPQRNPDQQMQEQPQQPMQKQEQQQPMQKQPSPQY
jgi:transcription initiation factor TFIID subunit 12